MIGKTMDDIQNMYKLLPEECDQLKNLITSWETARTNKEWIVADNLREQIKLWDTQLLCVDGLWYPILEHNLNFQRRICKRMIKYNVPIYPYDLTEIPNMK